MRNYVKNLVRESLQIDIEYDAETIDDDLQKLQQTVEQKKGDMQKNIEAFQEETSTVPFSTVHDSIIDYLNEKAALEYLQLASSARKGTTDDSQGQGTQGQQRTQVQGI